MPRLRSRGRTMPEMTFAKLRDVLSPHCGIVTEVNRFDLRDRGLAGLYGYGATLETATPLGFDAFRRRRAEQAEIWRAGAEGRNGNRVAFDRTRAFVRCVGEALERYACCTYDPGIFVQASWREVRGHALDPRACQHPSPEEYAALPLEPFREDAPLRWQWAWRLPDGAARLVPAQMCYLMYNRVPGEPWFTTSSSTGWALHHTWEEAIHTGLREVVERDSFMLAWLHRLRVPTLDLGSVDEPDLARWLGQMREGGARVRVLVTTTDLGIPSFAVAASDPRPGRPAFLLTLGAHPDPRRGLRQAVEEAAMMRLDLTARIRAGLVQPPARMQDITDMSHHGEYYLDPAHLGPVDWLLEDTPTVRLDEIPDHGASDVHAEMTWMVDRLAAAGHETLVLDGTPPDLREAGWVATKVLVPGTVRHEYGYGARFLACPRIHEAPVRMGHRAAPTTDADLNPDAHPYS
jgi:ribosomal protein S12 methylthiotransferase accessory factor